MIKQQDSQSPDNCDISKRYRGRGREATKTQPAQQTKEPNEKDEPQHKPQHPKDLTYERRLL